MPAALDALAAFPVAPGEVRLAAYSENLTFRVVDSADGAAYALRLHRPGYNSLDELQAEQAWIEALAAAGLSVPAIVRARDGRVYVETPATALSPPRFASLTRWESGRLLSAVLAETRDPARVAAHLQRLGAITARMHDQADGWSTPPLFTRRRLDLDALIGGDPVWGRFDRHPALSAEERRRLLRGRDHILAALGGLSPTPPAFGLIHADIHPDNVVIDGARMCILDFDDAAFGWRLYDIAVGLFYLHGRADAAETERAYLDGYRAVRKLDDAALGLLPFFRLARGIMMIGWFEQRPKLSDTPVFRQIKETVLGQCETLGADRQTRKPQGDCL